MIWCSNRDAGRIKNNNGRMEKLFGMSSKMTAKMSV